MFVSSSLPLSLQKGITIRKVKPGEESIATSSYRWRNLNLWTTHYWYKPNVLLGSGNGEDSFPILSLGSRKKKTNYQQGTSNFSRQMCLLCAKYFVFASKFSLVLPLELNKLTNFCWRNWTSEQKGQRELTASGTLFWFNSCGLFTSYVNITCLWSLSKWNRIRNQQSHSSIWQICIEQPQCTK